MTKGFLSSLTAIAVGLGGLAAPALAQADGDGGRDGFSGVYVGGSFGGAFQPNDRNSSSILFDGI